MNPLGAEWRKSTRSAQGDRVEVSYRADANSLLMRDTKAEGNGPVLAFPASEWSAFLAGVRDGEFNIPS